MLNARWENKPTTRDNAPDSFSNKTDNQMAQNGVKNRLGSFPAAAAYLIVGYDLEENYVVSDKFIEDFKQKAIDRARMSSEREKVATKAERDSEDMKKAEFMQDKIGQEYEGIVSSVTQFGIFVELENTVEGLIRFENLGNEYFIYDEDRKRLIGENSNKVYKIGDKVKIRVISANKLLRQIDFEIVEA